MNGREGCGFTPGIIQARVGILTHADLSHHGHAGFCSEISQKNRNENRA